MQKSIYQVRTPVWRRCRALLCMWLVGAAACRSTTLYAAPFFHLERLRLTGAQFIENRDAQTPQYEQDAWDKRGCVDFDWNIAGVVFMENTMHLETLRTGAVKTAGWHWVAGLRLWDGIDVGHEHHSQHILDEPSQVPRESSNKFPVEDSYVLRITIFEDTKARGSLFK